VNKERLCRRRISGTNRQIVFWNAPAEGLEPLRVDFGALEPAVPYRVVEPVVELVLTVPEALPPVLPALFVFTFIDLSVVFLVVSAALRSALREP
jgi:hypothetical protein